MKLVAAAAVSSSMIVAACNGTIVTEIVQPSSLTPGWSASGILTYPPSLFIETTRFTVLIDETGKVTKTSDNTDRENRCFPIKTARFVVRPDYSRPHVVRYNPGLLETNKFTLNLSEGMVTSVNSESAPDRGESFKNVVEAVGNIIPLPAARLAGQPTSLDGTLPCNAGPVVIGLRRCDSDLQECDRSIR